MWSKVSKLVLVVCTLCTVIESRYAHNYLEEEHHGPKSRQTLLDSDDEAYRVVYNLGTCNGLSAEVGCPNCTAAGHCYTGLVPIDAWLYFALKTQREIQIDKTFNHIQMFDAHNAYNNRADGYGANDTCNWPPPYESTCVNIANHEFSLTDLFNMGIRAIELDNWWCHEAMRLAHLLSDGSGCQSDRRLFGDGIKEIADWLDIPGNEGEVLRIYMNEKQDQGHDDEVNDPISLYLGSKVLTPEEFNTTYDYQWPTMRQMRMDGKNVVIAAGSTAGSGEFYTHGDHFIHRIFWEDIKVKEFSDYPDCGGKTKDNALRFYSDSTKYGRAYDGTKQTGTILDFTEYVKCNIQYAGADQINPEMMETAVFTWAEGEPSTELTAETCVILNVEDGRWYVASSCNDEHMFACQSITDPHDWATSTIAGPFDVNMNYCPDGYRFSIPHDGLEQQKLLEVAGSAGTLWLDYTPWLPGYTPPIPTNAGPQTTDGASVNTHVSFFLLIIAILSGLVNLF